MINGKLSKFYKGLNLKDLIFLYDEVDFSENIFYSVIRKTEDSKNVKNSSNIEFDIARGITTEKLILDTVRFYSMRMLVMHLKYLNKTTPEHRDVIIDEFERTHKHDSLIEYIETKLDGKQYI